MQIGQRVGEGGGAIEVGRRGEDHILAHDLDRAAGSGQDGGDRQAVAQRRIGIRVIGQQRGERDGENAVFGDGHAVGRRDRRIIQDSRDGDQGRVGAVPEADPFDPGCAHGFVGRVREGIGPAAEGDVVIGPVIGKHQRVIARAAIDTVRTAIGMDQVIARAAAEAVIAGAAEEDIIARRTGQGIIPAQPEEAVGGSEAGEVVVFCIEAGKDLVAASDRDGDGLVTADTLTIRHAQGEGFRFGLLRGERLCGGAGIVERVGPGRAGDGHRAIGAIACADNGPCQRVAAVGICGRKRTAGGDWRQRRGQARAGFGDAAGDDRGRQDLGRVIGAVDRDGHGLRGRSAHAIGDGGNEIFGDDIAFGKGLRQRRVKREGPGTRGGKGEGAIGRGRGGGPCQTGGLARVHIAGGELARGGQRPRHRAIRPFAGFFHRAKIAAGGRCDLGIVIGAGDGDLHRRLGAIDRCEGERFGQRLPGRKGLNVGVGVVQVVGPVPCIRHGIGAIGRLFLVKRIEQRLALINLGDGQGARGGQVRLFGHAAITRLLPGDHRRVIGAGDGDVYRRRGAIGGGEGERFCQRIPGPQGLNRGVGVVKRVGPFTRRVHGIGAVADDLVHKRLEDRFTAIDIRHRKGARGGAVLCAILGHAAITRLLPGDLGRVIGAGDGDVHRRRGAIGGGEGERVGQGLPGGKGLNRGIVVVQAVGPGAIGIHGIGAIAIG